MWSNTACSLDVYQFIHDEMNGRKATREWWTKYVHLKLLSYLPPAQSVSFTNYEKGFGGDWERGCLNLSHP